MGHFFSSLCGSGGGEKSWFTAISLSFFLGFLGADRFYFDCICTGLLKLLVLPLTLIIIGLCNMFPPLNILGALIGTIGWFVFIGWWAYDVGTILFRKNVCSGYFYGGNLGQTTPIWEKKLREDAKSTN